jgi:hypothetical protein
MHDNNDHGYLLFCNLGTFISGKRLTIIKGENEPSHCSYCKTTQGQRSRIATLRLSLRHWHNPDEARERIYLSLSDSF